MESPEPSHQSPAVHPDVDPERAELSALVRLVGVLGFTVCGGIIGFFFAGVAIDRYFNLDGSGVIAGILIGLASSLYWAYRTIARHLERFEKKSTADIEKQHGHE